MIQKVLDSKKKLNTLKGKKLQILKYLLQAISVSILVPMAFLKLSRAEESLYVFSELGMEPHGRVIIAVLEIIASLFLLTKNYAHHGAFLVFGVVIGAFIAHATVLGFEVNQDEGVRFYFLMILTISLSSIMYIERKRLLFIGKVLI